MYICFYIFWLSSNNLHIYFVAQIIVALAIGSSFRESPVSFWYNLSFSSLIFGTSRCSRITWYFLCLSSRVSHFCFLYLVIVVWKPRSEHWIYFCYLSVIASNLFQWTMIEHICMPISPYIHTIIQQYKFHYSLLSMLICIFFPDSEKILLL